MLRLAYPMRFEPADEGGFCVQGLPPLENVLTEGDTLEEAYEMAQEALSVVLSFMIDEGKPVPRPGNATGRNVHLVEAAAGVAAPILLRWAREDARLSQAEMAKRMGIKQQTYSRFEKPDANPRIDTLAKAFKAAGKKLSLAI